jgi:hypothetical protein
MPPRTALAPCARRWRWAGRRARSAHEAAGPARADWHVATPQLLFPLGVALLFQMGANAPDFSAPPARPSQGLAAFARTSAVVAATPRLALLRAGGAGGGGIGGGGGARSALVFDAPRRGAPAAPGAAAGAGPAPWAMRLEGSMLASALSKRRPRYLADTAPCSQVAGRERRLGGHATAARCGGRGRLAPPAGRGRCRSGACAARRPLPQAPQLALVPCRPAPTFPPAPRPPQAGGAGPPDALSWPPGAAASLLVLPLVLREGGEPLGGLYLASVAPHAFGRAARDTLQARRPGAHAAVRAPLDSTRQTHPDRGPHPPPMPLPVPTAPSSQAVGHSGAVRAAQYQKPRLHAHRCRPWPRQWRLASGGRRRAACS